uniref:Uncharacterized protein n=1 Tax=Tetranychus urticae TaxID=32264 RepID=T1JPX5_TETUR
MIKTNRKRNKSQQQATYPKRYFLVFFTLKIIAILLRFAALIMEQYFTFWN